MGSNNMKRQVVPRQVVAETIGDALKKLVDDPASSTAMQQLGHVLRADEALGVAKLVIEERVRCARCQTAVPHSRSDGPLCLGCAVAAKNEMEANQ